MEHCGEEKEIKENKETEDECNMESFVIEYPLNYNEIVERKLMILERDYEDTIKCNFKPKELDDNDNNNKSSDDEANEGNYEADKNRKDKNQVGDEKESAECREDNKYYQYLNENEEEEFIEVNEECKNEEKNYLGDNLMVITKEAGQINTDISSDSKQNETSFEENKPKLFTLKNPEKIKNAMKSINMNPPKWAQNLSDEDFLRFVKNNMSLKS